MATTWMILSIITSVRMQQSSYKVSTRCPIESSNYRLQIFTHPHLCATSLQNCITPRRRFVSSSSAIQYAVLTRMLLFPFDLKRAMTT
ncbi:unnamed protein product [Albugo candida]|uniref:Secreted protein n=1 Tax=Albugo candida TaxID=65357 RepID=A0A024GKV4_9STRA|nr:unnamed protein product [Albugo candida]|eukprot:CCI47506.1 unnamed protein product [Albugo candida]